MVWVIRWQFNGVWVYGIAGIWCEIAVGVGDVVLGIKRLTLLSVGPVDAIKDTIALKVEVCFAWLVIGWAGAVAGVIACIAKIFGDEANVLR